mgnify:CR=1 FL=1
MRLASRYAPPASRCLSRCLTHSPLARDRSLARTSSEQAIAKYLKYCLELDFTLTVKDEEKREYVSCAFVRGSAERMHRA